MSQAIQPLCLWCVHFHMDTGEPGYSDMTPGGDFTMQCAKDVWRWHLGGAFNRTIRSAERCSSYEFDAERLLNGERC